MATTQNSAQQQVHIRLPAELHAELVKRAESHAVSLNTVIKLLLADAVGWHAKAPSRRRS